MSGTGADLRTHVQRRAVTFARKAAKVGVVPLGVFGRRRPQDVVILGYHRVGGGVAEIDLAPSTFARQLDVLAARGEVRSLDDALRGGGAVVITFDDGTRDFHERVVPMLVERRLPAVLYLATAMAEDPEPLGLGPGLTWSMLEEVVGTGFVTVGSHTHRHANLARMTAAEAREEMTRSKQLIEDRLGQPCRHFAYPWGVGSPEADRVARGLFDTAAIDGWRTNRWGAIDPYRLGRTPILRSDGMAFFRLKAEGMLDRERYLYQAVRRGPWGKA
jgi:peptidoglycan/xylan/chitin deacetylase (PgdA/CDA1 family)